MRKNIKMLGGAIVSAAILSAVAATPNVAAPGQPGLSSVSISGEVPAITVLPSAPDSATTGANASLHDNAVSIDALADSEAHLNGSSISLTYSGVTTNYPAIISLYSSNKALKNGSNFIKYSAKATLASAPTSPTTGFCEFQQNLTPICTINTNSIINEGNIIVNILTEPDAIQILPKGIYSDTLTLKVGASL